MKIGERIKQRMTFSFEVFPPKEDDGIPGLQAELKELFRFSPDFVSCTYGAGGTNAGKSREICKFIAGSAVTCMSHFTCIGNSKRDILEIVKSYIDLGIENFLPLRGDFPKDPQTGKARTNTDGDFEHANFLIGFLKENFPAISMGCAGYAEKHILAPSLESDIAFLKAKQDAGAEFIMLQLCHDISAFSRFREKCYRAGIRLPMVMGLMPVLSRDSIINMTVSNGCSIPPELAAIIGKYTPVRGASEVVVRETAADFKKAGMEYTVKSLWGYMAAGVDGIHIYTLNRSPDVAKIVSDSGIKTTVVRGKIS
ncbi:MAG: methylenetetrahydrofolate reductase [Treponema sp.]|nr:methylenetetrahydrofolate reductase [Treponema sp.]